MAAVVGALRAGDAAAGLPAWGEEATCAAQLLLSNLNRASGGRRIGRDFLRGDLFFKLRTNAVQQTIEE